MCVCVAALSATARAENAAESAQQHFDRGAKLYNLGHFQEAIGDFEKAYDLDPSPIFLFNIAQSHRQLGNKERALFFYRRYLEQAPNAGNRDDVEKRMKDLQASLQQEAELKQKPPTEVESHVSPRVPAEPGPGGNAPVDAPPVAPAGTGVAPWSERPWTAGVELGPTFASMSGSQVNLPTLFSARLEGGYAFAFGRGALIVGADIGYAHLAFTRIGTTAHPALAGTSGSSAFWSLLASVRGAYAPVPALSLAAGIDAGYIFWSGLDEGNPFTEQGVAPSGAIAMPTIGASARGAYQIADGLSVTLTPGILWSKITSSSGNAIAGVISSVTRFDLMVGAAYAF